MKTKMAFKLTFFAILITVLGQCLRGHDFLTGLGLVILALWAAATVTYAIIARRRGFDHGDGDYPPCAPIPIPPSRPRPPELSAAARREWPRS